MFITAVSADAPLDREALATTANQLRGGTGPAKIFHDRAGRFGVAAGVAGLLPEDQFDAQPLIAGDLVFVCQVRLDDREEVSEKLELRIAEAKKLADSSLLFLAYKRWGEELVQHVTGSFSFAAVHRDSGRVVAGVDHHGEARLYYANIGRTLVVGTQLAALRCWPGLSLTPDPVAIGLITATKRRLEDTPYREIRVLPGGHLLTWLAGEVRTKRWWLPDCTPRHRYRDSEQYVELVGEHLRKAVKARLRATGPVCSTLSGGLDSGLVTANAATLLRENGARLNAYTAAPRAGEVCFERCGWEVDDAPFAAATAGLYDNIEHKVLRSDTRVALDLIPALHTYSATPVRNGANHLWFDAIAREMRGMGARVLLTGALGNFSISFSGQGAIAESLSERRPADALRLAWALARSGERSAWRGLAASVLGPRLTRAFKGARKSAPVPDAGSLSFLNDEFRSDMRHHLDPDPAGSEIRSALARGMTRPGTVWAADPLTQWGIEYRDPLADRGLLECLLSLPLAVFMTGGRPRGLARTVARNMLPESIRLRRTLGAQAADYPAIMARSAERYEAAWDEINDSSACRHMLDLPRMRDTVRLMRAKSLDLLESSFLDRAFDAGLFLARFSKAGAV